MSRRAPHPIVAELREIRRDRGLTQEAVARRMGRGRKALSQWERGIYTPSVETTDEWATALGVTLALLQTRKGNP